MPSELPGQSARDESRTLLVELTALGAEGAYTGFERRLSGGLLTCFAFDLWFHDRGQDGFELSIVGKPRHARHDTRS